MRHFLSSDHKFDRALLHVVETKQRTSVCVNIANNTMEGQTVCDPIILGVHLIRRLSDDLNEETLLQILIDRICPQNQTDAFIHIYNQDTIFFFLHPDFCPRIAHIHDTVPSALTENEVLFKHKYGLSRVSKVGYKYLNRRLKNYYKDAVNKHHIHFDIAKQQFADNKTRKIDKQRPRFSKRIHSIDSEVSLKQTHEIQAFTYAIKNKNADKRGIQQRFIETKSHALYVQDNVQVVPLYVTDSHLLQGQEDFPVQATDRPFENVDFHLPTLTTNPDLHETSTSHPRAQQSRHPDYVTECARRETFSTWPHDEDLQNVDNLVKYGFFYTGQDDLVRCYQCGLGLRDWSNLEDPVLEHARHSSECPHLADTVPQEELQQYRAAVQGLQTSTADDAASHRLRHPEYKGLQARIRSFSEWPTHLVQTPEQLAEAGFYYTGLQDQVRCYSCDGGLQHWDTEDEPWIEHARWFPHCQHVRTEKGQPYIHLVQLALQENDDAPGHDFAASARGYNADGATGGGRESDDPIYSQDAQNVIINCGFSKAAVKMAIEECVEKKIRWNSNILANLLYDKQARGEVLPTDSPRPVSPVNAATNTDVTSDEALAEENKRLQKRMLCILCEKRDTNTLFLPCDHHRMCAQCAADVTMCPMCGKTIKEKVKTFMA